VRGACPQGEAVAVRSIEEDLEADLSDFKARWAVTAARLEYLPQELP